MRHIIGLKDYEWEKLTGVETESLLRENPNARIFIRTWNKMSFWNWAHVLKEHPEMLRYIDQANLSQIEWEQLCDINNNVKEFYTSTTHINKN